VPTVTITAAICTRDRPTDVRRAVESVLACVPPPEQIVVVDQSHDDQTVDAIAALAGAERVTIVRSSQVGLSNARNTAIAASSGIVLAFTDDDCTVDADWVSRTADVFRDDEVMMAFGRVSLPRPLEPGEHAASFEAEPARFEGRLPRPSEPWGIGANMAMRLDPARGVVTFDPLLGAGAVLRSGEEVDVFVRMVASGGVVVYDPLAHVTHHGIRSTGDAGALAHGYAVGVGAAIAKHARLGLRPGRALVVAWPWDATRNVARRLGGRLRGRRAPLGVRSLQGMLSGVCAGIARPVDRASGTFRADVEPSWRSALRGMREVASGR
jgi:hypothetical protein